MTFQQVLEKEEHLRIEVDGGGCSGFEYKLKVDKNVSPDDLLWTEDGIGVVVDEVRIQFML